MTRTMLGFPATDAGSRRARITAANTLARYHASAAKAGVPASRLPIASVAAMCCEQLAWQSLAAGATPQTGSKYRTRSFGPKRSRTRFHSKTETSLPCLRRRPLRFRRRSSPEPAPRRPPESLRVSSVWISRKTEPVASVEQFSSRRLPLSRRGVVAGSAPKQPACAETRRWSLGDPRTR